MGGTAEGGPGGGHPHPSHGHQAGDPGPGGLARDGVYHLRPQRRHPAAAPRYTALKLGLTFEDRADLYARIDRRVDEMAGRGLAGEVRALLDSGVSPRCTAMQAIGYKELAGAISGGRAPEDAFEEVKLRSRQYAKRQLTWFRRDRSTVWFRYGSEPDLPALRRFVTEKLTESGIQ